MRNLESGAYDNILLKHGATVARILLVLLSKVQNVDHLSYLLTYLHDLLTTRTLDLFPN
jgi:hypothetical protein